MYEIFILNDKLKYGSIRISEISKDSIRGTETFVTTDERGSRVVTAKE